jgi:nicotinamide-nucleotide amidase
VQAFFAARGVTMPPASRNQARFPVGAHSVPNDLGTATGFQVVRAGKHLFALPGVHAEMKAMLREHVIPRICDAFPASHVHAKILKLADIGESQIMQKLREHGALELPVSLAFYPHHGLLDVRITARAHDTHEADSQIAAAEAVVREVAGAHVYATGTRSLAETIGNVLVNRTQTLAVAESCTGGLLMNLLTDIPGSSNWFERGFVTYSNAAKSAQLGVPHALIEQHGAVSEHVVRAMAEGVRTVSGTAWGVAITGIAGPDGGSTDKPVGTVWIAVSSEIATSARLYKLGGERTIIKLRAAHSAMYNLWRRLLEE